jgi:photosystem II stability/assembly factor-like uncharacterized protein
MELWRIFFKCLLIIGTYAVVACAQWEHISIAGSPTINALTVCSSTSNNLLAATNQGVYFSTDKGTNWIKVNTSCFDVINANPNDVSGNSFYASSNGSVFLSTDKGVSWVSIDTAFTSAEVTSLAVSDSMLFAATNGDGIFLANQYKRDWKSVNNTALPSNYVFSLATIEQGTTDKRLYAATAWGFVYSTDNGTSWAGSGLNFTEMDMAVSLAVHNNQLFVLTEMGGIYYSSDNGVSWNHIDTAVISINNDFFPSTTSFTVNADADDSTQSNLFIVSGSNSIWRRSITYKVTDVTDKKQLHMSQFVLHQNYPNPFNPSTAISFYVPAQTIVTLKVYDLLGKEVATLVNNETMSAGSHTKQWNASTVSSGMYFYRMQAGVVSQSRKMMVVK